MKLVLLALLLLPLPVVLIRQNDADDPAYADRVQ